MKTDICSLFTEVAATYDRINHLLTGGLDVLWRRRAARFAASRAGGMWLDVCTGTGDMAAELSRLAGNDATVVAADFCLPMIRKAFAKGLVRRVQFVAADVGRLPFRNATCDLVTISFATRNIAGNPGVLLRRIREFHRILKPGGRFVNLETSQPPCAILRKVFHAYVRTAVEPLGHLLSRSKSGYAYLAHTIPRFYRAEEFAGIVRRAGFREVRVHRMALGAVAIHIAAK
jgi:demethylmenaquinone methyltransferase/2-methoxy-6-polyprenyl-1,4-benzoquinol methylase